MCFSAPVSFASGVILSATGIVATGKVEKPEQKLLASVPFLFALQQFAESALWVTLRSGNNDWLRNAGIYAFLIAALVIWPVVVPLAMLLMEKETLRRRVLGVLLLAGIVLGAYYAYCIANFSVTAEIEGHHILYIDSFPARFIDSAFYLYILATVVPLFVSSVRRMKLFGGLIAVSLAVSAAVFAWYLTSVWCFFAAAASLTIVWILKEQEHFPAVPSAA
jgi:hypothetical protein